MREKYKLYVKLQTYICTYMRYENVTESRCGMKGQRIKVVTYVCTYIVRTSLKRLPKYNNIKTIVLHDTHRHQ